MHARGDNETRADSGGAGSRALPGDRERRIHNTNYVQRYSRVGITGSLFYCWGCLGTQAGVSSMKTRVFRRRTMRRSTSYTVASNSCPTLLDRYSTVSRGDMGSR